MLKETLTTDLVTTDLPGADKDQIIRALMDLICKSGKVKDPELALDDVLAHETGMSTGMEHGIAIPHAKSDAVDELVACVGISKRKIDFESLDRKPAQIFVMTLSPRDGTGPHVQFLAEISRLLKEPKLRRKLLKAKTEEELLSLLTK
ncbi:MAG: PTS sugar transporter subunit IIA [Spirochaetaceae bacterium]|nr:MAG: PTS sugar transporter subunit IIA [Spirochaetaceae bacterium]